MTLQVLEESREELARQVEEVRREITDVLLEIDYIELQLNPRIEADYAVKIGCYENELLKEQVAARRAKRRLALAQARANRGERVSPEEIEGRLDEEFEEWEAQLAARIDDYISLLEKRKGSRPLTPGEANEIRRLHRLLVKRLHPDLNPNLDEGERRLFEIAQGAYENGDLEMLRSLEVATGYLTGRDSGEPGSADELRAELELLGAQLRVTQERLNVLKSLPPYSLRENLGSRDWVQRRVGELKGRIEEQKAARKFFNERYRDLLEAYHE